MLRSRNKEKDSRDRDKQSRDREKESQNSDDVSVKEKMDRNQWKIKKQMIGANNRQEENKTREEAEPSMFEYALKNLLSESADREERYINFIKQQKQQLFSITQRYLEVMNRYEKQIKDFITKKQQEKQQKRFEKVHKMTVKYPPNLYNKIKYTTESEYELNCRIVFKYIIPILEDYLKEAFPSKFCIEFTQYYPRRDYKTYHASFDPAIDRDEVADRIKNGYSIEICAPDLMPPCYDFIISHFHDKILGSKILRYFRSNQIQFLLRNEETGLFFGYGKIDLEQLLQFNPENEETWVEKVPIVSLEGSDKMIACVWLELTTKATSRKIAQEHSHKVSEPMALNQQQIKIYNDRQSRLIQRINQYKHVHQSIIPSGVKESADKNILMHQKRKELEQIESYKQATKDEYMHRVFEQAIEQYHTENIQIGECKYVHFIYSNHTDRHQRAKINLSCHQLKHEIDKGEMGWSGWSHQENNHLMSIEIVQPAHVVQLIQQQILSYPTKADNCSIDFTIDNNSVFVVTGESILLYVKIICQTLALAKYQLNLELVNDFGEVLHHGMVILKSSPPVPTHLFPMYTYPGEATEIRVQVPAYSSVKESFNLIGKAKVANVVGSEGSLQFETNWTQNYQILQLKVTTLPKVSPNKILNCYLLIYDVSFVLELACFQFSVQCLQKIQDQVIELGRTQSFTIKLKLPAEPGVQQKKMVRIGTSDYLGSHCTLVSATHKIKEFPLSANVQYPIMLNYNTFAQNPSSDKLIISCMDLETQKPLQRLALMLKKTPTSVKAIHRLVCPRSQPLQYNFDLNCGNKQQTIYKLYSSNYSLMTTSEETLVLFSGQSKRIKLVFHYWQSEDNLKYKNEQEKRSVILAVDDAKVCLLYLFEIRPEDAY